MVTRTKILIVIASFSLVVAGPAPAQDSTSESGLEGHASNLHIGGGIGVPLAKTSDFAGLSGTFQIGAGPNLNEHNSIVGEFMWEGLPPTRNALAVLVNPLIAAGLPDTVSTSNNLYALTANYMFHREGHRYGYYLIGGGGWYYRHIALKNYTLVPGTVCAPAWDWWGYACQGGLVSTSNTLASKGVSSGGVNGGVGFTINLGDSGVKYYMEARYHYSPQGGQVSTQLVPVTFGFRW
jgi:hypothetical protein